ncbi:MAG: DUF4249 domain-containing protein [Tunicatimonas sp.]|uniref:DUF4249 domain-containing protein n=1 Tax=Tunicatimonas sp. TaxID=1940096 RepID=UPI003C775450
MKKLKRYYLLGLLSCGLLAACEDVIEVEAPRGEPRLVVDGWVYDDRDMQTVLLKNSAPYFESGDLPPETEAAVSVETKTGETFNYTEAEPGVYQADFRGAVGQHYTLRIETSEGQRYESTLQALFPVAPLDTVYTVFRDSPDVEDEGYYPAWEFIDLKNSEDYYRWKFYINDTLQSSPEDIVAFSDEFVDGEQIKVTEFILERTMAVGDKLTLEQLSISEDFGDFLIRVQQLTAGVGGLFDTPPDPVRGNITNVTDEQNYALGFFGASSVVRDSVVVGE